MIDFLKNFILPSFGASLIVGTIMLIISFIFDFNVSDVYVLISMGVVFIVSFLATLLTSRFSNADETDSENSVAVTNVIYYYNEYQNGMSRVERITICNGEQKSEANYVDSEGNLVGDTWYELGSNFYKNCAIVYNEGKYAIINKSGVVISDWYIAISDFKNGTAKVMNSNNMINFIRQNGTLLWKEWKNAQ